MARAIQFPNIPKEYTFSNVAQVTVNHNLGYFPKVTIILDDGSVVYGDISHTNTSQVVITFQISITGTILIG